MSDAEFLELKKQVADHHMILHGKPDALDGGIVSLCVKTGEAMFGSKNDMGIAAEVRALRGTIQKWGGALIVTTVVAQAILTMLMKTLKF